MVRPGPHRRCRWAGPALGFDLPRIAELAVYQSPTWRWPGVRRPRGPAQRPTRPAQAPCYGYRFSNRVAQRPAAFAGLTAPSGSLWRSNRSQFADRAGPHRSDCALARRSPPPGPADPPAASIAGFAAVAPTGHLPVGHCPDLALRVRRRPRANRGCAWRCWRRALATLKRALRCPGQPTPTSWNRDAPPSTRSWAAKARRDPAPAGREPPFGGMPAGGSIRRQRIPMLRASSRRSGVLQPATTTSSQRVDAPTLATRTTSRVPSHQLPPQARVDYLLRGVCGTCSMRSPVENAYPGFRSWSAFRA